jgi:elongation factor G
MGRYRANYSTSIAKGKKWALKPKEDWVYIKVPAIISEELWKECNAILDDQKNFIKMKDEGVTDELWAEMVSYAPVLTSMTGGRGTYHMEFSHYDEVPAHIAQKIIEEASKEGKKEEEE